MSMSFVAQQVAEEGSSGSPVVTIVAALVGYVFYALCWSAIARKSGHADKAWWAWVPILNFVLPVKVAQRSMLWLVLLLVPFVNIVAWLLICMSVARARNRGAFSGALAAFVPIIGLPLLAMGE